MKSQTELLQGTGIPSDQLPGIQFTPEQETLFAEAESIVFDEWATFSKIVGFAATAEHIPEIFDLRLQRLADTFSPSRVNTIG